MSSNRTLMVLPGDGVGPEVVKETLRVVDWFAKNKSISFNIKEGLVGGASFDKYGTPLSDETLSDAIDADAILFGAIGHPKYDNDPKAKVRPEQGLLKMRKKLADIVLKQKPIYEPGSKFEYSNWGYGILGAILEKYTKIQGFLGTPCGASCGYCGVSRPVWS